jgi:hypothetical protein
LSLQAWLAARVEFLDFRADFSPEGPLPFRSGPNLSETAGAGDRLSLSGLHETGDERFDGCGMSRNREIGLNLVVGSSADLA